MKKVIGILILTFIIHINMNAQRPQPRGGDHLDKLKTELNLSDDQINTIKEKNEALREEMKAIRESDLSREEMKEKMMGMRGKHEAILLSVLTEEQKEKFETLKAEREAKKGDRPQHREGHDKTERGHHHKMQEALGLTEEQINTIEEKNKALKEEMVEMKKSGKASKEEMMQKIQEMKEKRKAILESVLTDEQKSKLATMEAEREAKMKEKMAKMQVMMEEIKAYKKENIDPVMEEKRAELDKKMKKKDRKVIDKLRDVVQEIRTELEANKDEMMAAPHHRGKRGFKGGDEMMKLWQENQEDFEKAMEIVEKYGDEIDASLESMESYHETWMKDMGAIKEKHMGEMNHPHHRGKKGHPHKGMKGKGSCCDKDKKCCEGKSCDKSSCTADKCDKGAKEEKKKAMMDKMKNMKRLGFLLMPSEMEEEITREIMPNSLNLSAKVFPNPSKDQNTLQLNIEQEGNYRIALYNETGAEIRVISDENLSVGEHIFETNLGQLPSGIYYYVITDGKNASTQKFIKK